MRRANWSCHLLMAAAVLAGSPARAETGRDAWLRYPRLSDPSALAPYRALIVLGDAAVQQSARDELMRGLNGLAGAAPGLTTAAALAASPAGSRAIVIGTVAQVGSAFPALKVPPLPDGDGFWLATADAAPRPLLVVAGASDRGVLYGTFALLKRIALRQPIAALDERQEPSAPIRWVNEWDNLDGTIERGYAGRSIFFEADRVLDDLSRAGEYARLLASVGINGCAANSVNANTLVLTDPFIPGLARIADAFRPWGVRLVVAVDFSSPRTIGGLDTFDPLDPRVAAFWKDRVDALYRAIPDLGGFVLKADSEGRLGPSAYGRTHADAANVIARALAPHGGAILYRGFVYDHHMDWRNPKNDRARAAFDNFQALDGAFDDNVVLQIKHGPIDFQVREPASPLFAALRRTNQSIELQITQEYLGQQRHLVYLVPMWKEVLDFAMTGAATAAGSGNPTVGDLVSGRANRRPLGGYVGVSNVGRDDNWLGHDLAMANLYGFGRLAWQPSLTSAQIADEWTRQTFGHEPRVVSTIAALLADSWPAYERYSGPLGAGTLTDIIGVHFGPGVESSERNGWGQWHRADERGIGMDRTSATGTGFIAQYPPPIAAIYESLSTCPDDLLLFMHHVPYTFVLKSGKTVIQHIYDTHYQGADEAAGFVDRWKRLDGLIDGERYAAVLARFEFQAGHAVVWRDSIVQWFARASGVPDRSGRAGHFPDRVEAESMSLDGYATAEVTPWETASGGHAVVCAGAGPCRATYRFTRAPGRYDVVVEYFDESDGASRYTLTVGGRVVDSWTADVDLPHVLPNGHTSMRRIARNVAIAAGDTLVITARPDRDEHAVLDYIELVKRP